jgi:hypothetical protein
MKLFALLCAFNLALLLERFLGGLLARTSGGTDVVVKPTLGHRAISSFDHLLLHRLLALGCLLRRTAHLDLNLDIAFTFAFTFTLHLFVAAVI